MSLVTGKSDDAGSKLLGIILVAAAANYFAITRLFSKDKRTQKSANKTAVSKRYVNQSIKNVPKLTNFHEKAANTEAAAGNKG